MKNCCPYGFLNMLSYTVHPKQCVARGIGSSNTHYSVKSQDQRGLSFPLSDVKFMNTYSFAVHFKKVIVYSNVLVE